MIRQKQKALKSDKLQQSFKWSELLLPLSVFWTAICFGLILSLSRHCAGSATLFDSGHYMGSSIALYESIKAVIGDPARLLVECRSLKDNLLLDGPVMPLLGCIPYWLSGSKPDLFHMQPVLVFMVFLHGLTAVGVFFLSRIMTANQRCAFAGGMLWALYPAALISTTKFLTEPVSCVLGVATVLLSYHSLRMTARPGVLFLLHLCLGLALSVFLMVRPIIAPGALIVCLMPLFFAKERARILKIGLVAFLVGASLVILPWLFYTKAASDKFYVFPQRQPIYNLFRGFNIESDGRETPLAPSAFDEMTRSQALALIVDRVVEQPGAFGAMALRKLPRLWCSPWNDYRFKILGLPIVSQCWWHSILVAFGCLGLVLFLRGLRVPRSAIEPSAIEPSAIKPSDLLALRFVGIASIWLILAHLPYLAFGTIPRYGYTGMPFVCLFAVYFLSQVRVRENQRPRYLSAAFFLLVFLVILPADLQGVLISAGVLTGLAFLGAVLLKGTLSLVSALILLRTVRPESSQSVSIFSALSILMVFAILAAVEAGPSREVVVDIAPGQKLIRKVDLAGKTPDWALILLDSSRRKPGLGLYLNGHQVAQEPMPLYRFGQDGFLMSSYQVFSGLLGIDTDRLRQWRAVSVPVAWLSSDGSNTVCLKAEREKLTLFASVPGLEGEQEIPSLTEFNFTKLASDLHDLDARIPAEKIRTVEPAYLIDGENKSRINGLPRLLVACGYRTEPHAAAALAKPVTATMLVEKSIVQPGVPLVLSSREPLSITGRGSFKITLQGIISSDADAGKMTLDLVCRRFLKPDFSVSVFGKPKEVVFNQGGSKKFSYSEFVPLSAVDGSAFRLEAMFGTGRKPIVVESLTVLMEPFESPDFRECSVEVF